MSTNPPSHPDRGTLVNPELPRTSTAETSTTGTTTGDSTSTSSAAPPSSGSQDKTRQFVSEKGGGLLGAIHGAGEAIRGTINGGLDGAGDAIAGRDSGSVSSRTEPNSGANVASKGIEELKEGYAKLTNLCVGIGFV